MRHSFRFLSFCVTGLLVSLVALAVSDVARAKDAKSDQEQAELDREKGIVRLTLHPAKEPRPALKYRFTVALRDRLPGNAAVYYGGVKAEQDYLFRNDEFNTRQSEWTRAPLAELRSDNVKNAWNFTWVFQTLDRAARCAQCDWQLPIGEGNYYTILLPQTQETRVFARLLAVRARIQIARGEYDEAVRTLRNGFALGRHVSNQETLVSGLVGVTNAEIICEQVETFIQQPDAPNLYWALTGLPRPLIDMRPGIEAERDAVWLSFPELRDVDKDSGDENYWRDKTVRFWRRCITLMDDYALHRSEIFSKRTLQSPEILAALAVRSYPLAKRDLIERGYASEKVEAMPVGRVLLLHMALLDQEARDSIVKEFYLPYPESKPHLKKVEDQFVDGFDSDYSHELIPLTMWLTPAMVTVREANVRVDRRIAALRVIEALRMHAASHGGRLPTQLDEVTEVPIPLDPSTGKPFFYQRTDFGAVLMSPPLSWRPIQYVIRMVP
ncbi:MAG: hypothetical protein JW818_10170 [Pirellulales bacterium]|nr:hypothetical protein [Pirellulales bacterium]